MHSQLLIVQLGPFIPAWLHTSLLLVQLLAAAVGGEAEEGNSEFPDLLKLLRAAWLIWPRNIQNKCLYREPSPLFK